MTKSSLNIALEIADVLEKYPFDKSVTALSMVLKSLIVTYVPKEEQELVVDKVANTIKKNLKNQ